MRGNALAWYGSLKGSDINTSIWTEFKKAFVTSYGEDVPPFSAVVDLTTLKQGQDEKVLDFYTRVTKVIIRSSLYIIVPSAFGHTNGYTCNNKSDVC